MLIILTLEQKYKFVKQENTRAKKHFAHTLCTHDLIPSHDRTSALVMGTFSSEWVTFHSWELMIFFRLKSSKCDHRSQGLWFFRLWCPSLASPFSREGLGFNLIMLTLAQHGELLSSHSSAWILTLFGWMKTTPLPLLILFVSVGFYVYCSFAFFSVCLFFCPFH